MSLFTTRTRLQCSDRIKSLIKHVYLFQDVWSDEYIALDEINSTSDMELLGYLQQKRVLESTIVHMQIVYDCHGHRYVLFCSLEVELELGEMQTAMIRRLNCFEHDNFVEVLFAVTSQLSCSDEPID